MHIWICFWSSVFTLHGSSHQRIVYPCVAHTVSILWVFVHASSYNWKCLPLPPPLECSSSTCDCMTNSINAQLNVSSSKKTWSKRFRNWFAGCPVRLKNQMKVFAPLHMIKHPCRWRPVADLCWMCYIAGLPILKENRNGVKIEMGREGYNLTRVNYYAWRAIKVKVGWREKS